MSKIFPEGIYFNKKRDGAPDFVRGMISIKLDQAIPFLEKHKNAQGYVNLDLLLSSKNEIYLALNEWKKPESVSSLTDIEKENIRLARERAIKEDESKGVDMDKAFSDF